MYKAYLANLQKQFLWLEIEIWKEDSGSSHWRFKSYHCVVEVLLCHVLTAVSSLTSHDWSNMTRWSLCISVRLKMWGKIMWCHILELPQKSKRKNSFITKILCKGNWCVQKEYVGSLWWCMAVISLCGMFLDVYQSVSKNHSLSFWFSSKNFPRLWFPACWYRL